MQVFKQSLWNEIVTFLLVEYYVSAVGFQLEDVLFCHTILVSGLSFAASAVPRFTPANASDL